jgi:hypothetical protein
LKVCNKLWLSACIFATAILFSAGCKPAGDTGIDVLPPDDLVGIAYTDTFSVFMETQVVDSIISGGLSQQMFGNYIDPEFGRVEAETYTQFQLRGSSVNFGPASNLIFDSLVLTLNVSGVYGRYDSPQRLRIYEITGDWLSSDSLTSRLKLDVDDTRELTGGHLIDFRNQSGFRDIRVRLDDALGEKILFADTADLAGNAEFAEFFKGIRIGTDPVVHLSREPGAIFYLDLVGIGTEISLYYQELDTAGTGEFRPRRFDFPVSISASRYHTLNRSESEDKLLGFTLRDTMPDPNQYEFLQAGALVKIFLKFPTITNLGQIGINRAEFVLKVDKEFFGSTAGANKRFVPPPAIRMLIADTTGSEVFPDGGVVLNTTAQYNSTNGTYSFQISNYVQELIAGKRRNNGVILVPDFTGITVNRAVFGGTQHPTLSPEMKVTYTTLPK